MPVDLCIQGVELPSELQTALVQDGLALLEAAGLDDSELSLAVMGDEGIQALNGQWRDLDMATDVLSFPQDCPGLLGDLAFSIETAQRQADARGHDLRTEFRILMVHGLLHLTGHDHEIGPEEHAEMARAEQALLATLKWEGEGLIALAESG
jgi:probable rRNA maturation factor